MEDDIRKLIKELESWGAEPSQVLNETFLDDFSFYKDCLIKFSQDENLSILRQSLVPEKIQEAIRAVHTLKGNSDYLGLFPITDAAVSVLTDLRKDQLELAIADIPELESAFDEFLKLIKPYSSLQE